MPSSSATVLMPLAGINGLAWDDGANAMMALDATIARINPRMVFLVYGLDCA
jgi:hypothetical protein